jgi:hypothetical protein
MGLGLALYFASQGFGRVAWPVTVGALRLAIAVGGAWLASTRLGAGLPALFVAITASLLVYAGAMALAAGALMGRR